MAPDWNAWGAATNQYHVYDYNYSSSATTVPAFLPVQVSVSPPPEPEPETSLDWLKGQVAEICDLAWAA